MHILDIVILAPMTQSQCSFLRLLTDTLFPNLLILSLSTVSDDYVLLAIIQHPIVLQSFCDCSGVTLCTPPPDEAVARGCIV